MGLGLGTMRRVVIEMGALLALSGLLGCAGGQTGEITEPSECDAIAETLAFEALPEEARAELEALSGPWREALAWDAGGETTLELSIRPERAEAVERLGFGGCLRDRVPATLTLATDDARLAIALDGWVELRDGAPVSLRGAAPLADEAQPALEELGPLPEGRLVAEMGVLDGALSGQLFVSPGPDQDEVRLASF